MSRTARQNRSSNGDFSSTSSFFFFLFISFSYHFFLNTNPPQTALPHHQMIHQSSGGDFMLDKATSQRCPAQWTRKALCQGTGFIVEGKLMRMHMHSVAPLTSHGADALPGRFIVLHLAVSRVTRRNWSAEGVEIKPDEEVTTTELRGYLTKVRTTERPDTTATDAATVAKFLTESAAKRPTGAFVLQTAQIHPRVAGVFEFWLNAAEYVAGDFGKGRLYRLKSIGDSPIVETIARMDDGTEKEVLRHYAGGDEPGAAWAAKVSKAAPQTAAAADVYHGPEEDRDDSEWD